MNTAWICNQISRRFT